MGKKLIIKGADFSQNAIQGLTPYLPFDLQQEILDESLLTLNSRNDYARFSLGKSLYDEYYSGKYIVGVKIKIATAGTLSFYIENPNNSEETLLETITFTNTGWQIVLFNNPVKIENGKYIAVQTHLSEQTTDTATFASQIDSSENVSDPKFSTSFGKIEDTTTALINGTSLYGFCFVCQDSL